MSGREEREGEQRNEGAPWAKGFGGCADAAVLRQWSGEAAVGDGEGGKCAWG